MVVANLESATRGELAKLRDRAADVGPIWTPLDEADPDEVVAALRQPVDAVATMWPSWNRASRDLGGGSGLARGWFAIGAGTTGTGKTNLGLNFAAHAIGQGEQVGYLSLETEERQNRTRLLAMLAREPVAHLEPGNRFDENVMRRALKAAKAVHRRTGGRLWTSDEPLYDLPGVLEAMNELRHSHGCRTFIVDYVQLAGNPNDPESITAIAHAVRRETRRLGAVTLGLSQFNRQTSNSGTRPTVHGLMGGSALENDADQIIILDQTSIESPPAPRTGWDGVAVLAKNRHGPSGVEIPIRFDSQTLRMTERLPHELPSEEAV